ncbi:hypothetical protein DFH06DRAFT_1182452 [Mycena polygramma]|nr:hypothetical protein DFH06DRAFT_1182452 [Mycena polygramma]
MHRCLQIAEIVDMVCSHLDPRSPGFQPISLPFRDLAAVARTCTIFRDPALDYLWCHAALGRLLTRCMPTDLWDVDTTEIHVFSKGRKVRLLRPIRTADWDRLRIYAPRVRRLSSGADFPMSEAFDLSKVFQALSVSLPHALFQNLQSLNWKHSEDEFHHIQLFLHPRLTKLSLVLSSDSASSLLSTLTSKCPRLNDVTIHTSPSYDREDFDPGPVSDFLCGLQNPEKISVPCVGQDALEHLSRLPTLKSLVLTGPAYIPVPSGTPGRPTFPGLRTLSFQGPRIGSTAQFLRLFNSVPLCRSDMTFYEVITAEEIHALFAGIAAGVSHSSLTALLLQREWGDIDFDPASCIVARRSIRLLLCFPNLTVLSITSIHGFDLDDTTAAEMARAWPRATTLHLKSNHHIRMPQTTAACLYSFAQYCPHLRQLALAFDGTTVPGPDTARPRVVQHSLRALAVEHSPVTNPISVARFLSGLFPSLDNIGTHREYDDNDVDDVEDMLENGDAIRNHYRWKEVLTLLPEVSAIREEGRAWAFGL